MAGNGQHAVGAQRAGEPVNMALAVNLPGNQSTCRWRSTLPLAVNMRASLQGGAQG